jgi:hypothetical protein
LEDEKEMEENELERKKERRMQKEKKFRRSEGIPA